MSVATRTALDLGFSGLGGRIGLVRRRYRWPLLIGRVFTDAARPMVGSVTVQNAAGTIIPGDVVTQRLEVRDGGSAEVRGQGATTVSGTPDGAVAVENTVVEIDGTSTLLLDASPRILTPDAHYRQHTRICVAPGGRAVVVDAVVLHPALGDDTFGSYSSTVEIVAPDGRLLALDAQLLETMPRAPRAPTAFATVYIVGGDLDTAMTVLSPEIEAAAAAAGGPALLAGVSDLPNTSGWVVRLAAAEGGALRAAISAVTSLLDRGLTNPVSASAVSR